MLNVLESRFLLWQVTLEQLWLLMLIPDIDNNRRFSQQECEVGTLSQTKQTLLVRREGSIIFDDYG